jgi:hypothetical protein
LVERARKNKLLSIRILLPSPQFEEEDIPSNISPNISIKYFDRHLTDSTITSILDSKFMYMIGSESDYVGSSNKFFIQRIKQ